LFLVISNRFCSVISLAISNCSPQALLVAVRAQEVIERRAELMAAIRPPLDARNAIEQQVVSLIAKL